MKDSKKRFGFQTKAQRTKKGRAITRRLKGKNGKIWHNLARGVGDGSDLTVEYKFKKVDGRGQ